MADVTDPTHDTVNGLFDESDDEDPFRDLDFDLDDRTSRKRKADSDKENGDLGVDEQIKITKKRKPIAKLDENRLLSDAGIPKLRRSYKSKLQGRFKGKGYEFADAEKLLNFFQLWLDNLFPKAKFADGLSMVEKVGHSKRMQIMRRTWIDEGKPKPDYVDDGDDELRPADRLEDAHASKTRDSEGQTQTKATTDERLKSISGNGAESLFVPEERNKPNAESGITEQDDLDALLAEESAPVARESIKRQPAAEEFEGEDDLDALLAEYDSRKPAERPSEAKWDDNHQAEDEGDDLDALLAEQDVQTKPSLAPTNAPQQDDDQDDLDVLLAEQENEQDENVRLVASQRSQSDQDDLDALNRANNEWIESL